MRGAGPHFDILVVEDEALLVMDLEAMLEDEGHRLVGEAMSLSEVESLSLDAPPDIAFVDIQLADNSSGLDVCRLIKDRWPSTAVVFLLSLIHI